MSNNRTITHLPIHIPTKAERLKKMYEQARERGSRFDKNGDFKK